MHLQLSEDEAVFHCGNVRCSVKYYPSVPTSAVLHTDDASVWSSVRFKLQQSTTSDTLSYHHTGECRGAHRSQQDSKLQTCRSPECQLLLIALIQLNLCYVLLAAPSDILPTLHPTYNSEQTAAPGRLHMQVMTGQRALWSRQRPPEQQFHSSVALTLMTAAVTKIQEHGRE